MKLTIPLEKLERLKEYARINEKGLANFILVENKDNHEHFIFRVVCQKVKE